MTPLVQQITNHKAPALSMEYQFDQVLKSQRRTVTVLSSLIAIQEAYGFLPPGSIQAVAGFCGTSDNDVYGVATFYTHFRFTPPGDHEIELCWGPSCHILDSPSLRKVVEELTGLDRDSTTPDNRYTFRELECAGACALAPVGKIDGKLYGRLTPQRLRSLIEGLKNKGPHRVGTA